MNNHYHPWSFNYWYSEQDGYMPPSTLKRRLLQGVFDLIGIVIAFLMFALIYTLAHPRIQFTTCDSADISFPKMNDTISLWVLGLVGSLVPITIMLWVEVYKAKLFWFQESSSVTNRSRRFGIGLFHGVSLFVFGIALTLLVTEVGKRAVGRLRPHFLAVCAPNFAAVNCLQAANTGNFFVSFTTGGSFCTGNAKDVEEARLSFPSGHSSFSMYTMLFLIFYLEARLVTVETRMIKSMIQIIAFIAAFYTSLSRIPDYAHRFSDVIGGAVVGIAVALLIIFVVGKVLWVLDDNRQEKRKRVEIEHLPKYNQQQVRAVY